MTGNELLRAIQSRYGKAPYDRDIEDIYSEGSGPFLVIQTYHTDDEPHYAFFGSATDAAEYVDDQDASLCWVFRGIVDVRDGSEITVERAYSFSRVPFSLDY